MRKNIKINEPYHFSAIKFIDVLCTNYIKQSLRFMSFIFTVKFDLFMIYVLFHCLNLSLKFQNKCICLNVSIMLY